jgi:TonB family protein
MGLPVGGVSNGSSLGPGSGGGVGTGTGTGIGSGTGSGLAEGSGGGTGGGVYRPGGSVTPPRLLSQVRPTYTADALARRVQGSVVLAAVVMADGVPAQIHVARSLDVDLDAQAIDAVRQWRFDPGRLAGRPVNVLVTVVLDFTIH